MAALMNVNMLDADMLPAFTPFAVQRRQQFDECAIAGTIFASTHLPLRLWFRAIYHLTQTKQGISSIELGRRLGVTQTPAWKVKHKLQQVMLERDATKRLTGRIEIDDAYLGGERHGGKRGRGAPGKTPFVAAVETTAAGKPVRDGSGAGWRTADRSSIGYLLPARQKPDEVVRIFAAQTVHWRGVFATHSSIVLKPAGADGYQPLRLYRLERDCPPERIRTGRALVRTCTRSGVRG